MKKSCAVRTSIVALATILPLLLLAHAFGESLESSIASDWRIPPGQPGQIWSKVDYDPKLADPFFESNEWSYPYWIIKHPDGTFESTRSDDERPVKDPPRLKHTAKCFSTAVLTKGHVMKFCEAKVLESNAIELSIKDEGAAFTEIMRVQIRNGNFKTEYTVASSGRPSPKGLRCAKIRRKLTLDKERYRKGDVIKGRIDYECVWESTVLKHLEESRGNPPGFKVYGVFKTVVK